MVVRLNIFHKIIELNTDITVEKAKHFKTDHSPQPYIRKGGPQDYHFIGSSFGRNSVPVLSEIFKEKQARENNYKPSTYDHRMNPQQNPAQNRYMSQEFDVNSPNCDINTYRSARGKG
jgi:hypothetical protein